MNDPIDAAIRTVETAHLNVQIELSGRRLVRIALPADTSDEDLLLIVTTLAGQVRAALHEPTETKRPALWVPQ